ncbi:sirohydrochlorin cobaltochelatase, partial [Desulfovibrio piger]
FTHVAVQPLQIIPGSEHTDVRADADEAGRLDGLHVSIGTPLLACDEDIRAAAQAVLAHLPEERRADEDVVLMGHGSRKQAVTAYAALAGAVQALDARVHVGTMSGALELEALLPRLTSRRVWLMPLLSVVGRHTLEDMAGDAPDSWRSRIEAAGHTCAPVVRGTAEYRAFADIWLRHLEDAVAALPTVKKDEEK